MKQRNKIKLIEDILQEYFPEPAVPLHHQDPYTLLIAVLLSAQCTDERVNKITPLLFERADSPQKMIELSEEEILEIIRPCGLGPRKAHAIRELSKILLEKHQGQVPASFEALEELPGVGHKTASVVMAQAFHQPAFPVDTHIHRCAKRWGLSDGKNVEKTEKDLKKAFSKAKWNRLHIQIILFARRFCPAKGHMVQLCPICQKLEKA